MFIHEDVFTAFERIKEIYYPLTILVWKEGDSEDERFNLGVGT